MGKLLVVLLIGMMACEAIAQNRTRTKVRVELVNGLNPFSGRVELVKDGVRGTVCDDSFDANDATVICRQLSLGNRGIPVFYTYSGGSGPIWLDELACNGTEPCIKKCSHNGWGINDCSHSEDVGVQCVDDSSTDVHVELVGGSSKYNGRVEIVKDGIRGTVCDDDFDENDATVICRQLSLGNRGKAVFYSYNSGSGLIWLDGLTCNGTESSISECSHNGWGINDCSHYEDVGVQCFDDSLPDIRLVGGNNSRAGRLEIRVNGLYGTVCDDYFNDLAATVACRELGLGQNGLSLKNNYGSGTGNIWLDNVQCGGNETNLTQCVHNGIGTNDCQHDEDVSIACMPDSPPDIQFHLEGGANSTSGRLIMTVNGIPGTVCDDFFYSTSASVVCRQMGLESGGTPVVASFGAGSGVIWLDNVQCTGNETDLYSCPHLPLTVNYCSHYEDVGVIC